MKKVIIALVLSIGLIPMAYAGTARYLETSAGYFLESDDQTIRVRSVISMEDYVTKLNGTGKGGAEFETIKYMDGKGYELINCDSTSNYSSFSNTISRSRTCYFRKKDQVSKSENGF